MPIYEYLCEACGVSYEAFQKQGTPLLTDCEACGKSSLKKLISAPSFRLKGTGWYETDFKNKAKKDSVKGQTQEPVAEAKESSTKTETKESSTTTETKSSSTTEKKTATSESKGPAGKTKS